MVSSPPCLATLNGSQICSPPSHVTHTRMHTHRFPFRGSRGGSVTVVQRVSPDGWSTVVQRRAKHSEQKAAPNNGLVSSYTYTTHTHTHKDKLCTSQPHTDTHCSVGRLTCIHTLRALIGQQLLNSWHRLPLLTALSAVS